MPLVVASLARQSGWRVASCYGFIIVASLCAITLPFYFYDPEGFSPLLVQYSKVARFGQSYSGVAIPAAAAVLSTVLAGFVYRRATSPMTMLFGGSAIVQALPVVATVILSTVTYRPVTFAWAGYGVFFLTFAVLALWPKIRAAEEMQV
jgi:hypothetical protein